MRGAGVDPSGSGWSAPRFLGVVLSLLSVLLVGWPAGCGGKRVTAPPASRASKPDEIVAEPAFSDWAERLLSTARAQLGRAYRWGGDSPQRGFDCSGFVQWVFAQHGIELPRSSTDQAGIGISVSRKEIQPGDLLFYAFSSRSSQPDHVGIYAGKGELIHSPRTGRGISVDPAFRPPFSRRFVAARRVAWVPGSEPSGAAPAPAQASEDQPRYYVVKKGDYVWRIARKLGISPLALLEANGLSMEDILQVGQRLLIPEP